MASKYIEYTPSDALHFRITLHEQTYTSLCVRNASSERIALKIKTTCVQRYTVRPSSAVIDPDGQFDIRFGLKAFSVPPEDLHDCRDRFLLLTAPLTTVPVGPDNIDEATHGYATVAALWAEIPPNLIMREKLPVHLVLVPAREHEDPPSAPLSPDTVLQHAQFPTPGNPNVSDVNAHVPTVAKTVQMQTTTGIDDVAPAPPAATPAKLSPQGNLPDFSSIVLGAMDGAAKTLNSTSEAVGNMVTTERPVAPIEASMVSSDLQPLEVDSDAVFTSVEGSLEHEPTGTPHPEPLLETIVAQNEPASQVEAPSVPNYEQPAFPVSLGAPDFAAPSPPSLPPVPSLAEQPQDQYPMPEDATRAPSATRSISTEPDVINILQHVSIPAVTSPPPLPPTPPPPPSPPPPTELQVEQPQQQPRQSPPPPKKELVPSPSQAQTRAAGAVVSDGAEVKKGSAKGAHDKKAGDGDKDIDYHSVEYSRERALGMNVTHTATLPELDRTTRHRVAIERAGELSLVIEEKLRVIDSLHKQLVEAQHRLSDARMATRPAYDVQFEINESGRVPLSQIAVMALISTALIQLLI